MWLSLVSALVAAGATSQVDSVSASSYWTLSATDTFAPLLGQPIGIDVDPNTGDVWVSRPVSKFAADGSPLVTVPDDNDPNAEPICGRGCWDVAVAQNGDIYLADLSNSEIVHLNSSGEIQNRFGSQGQGPGQLYFPAAIALDANGDVWVAEQATDRIQRFSPDGTFEAVFGSSDATGAFNYGLAFDSDGYLWVASKGGDSIRKLDPADGSVILTIPLGPSEPIDLVFDEAGQMHVVVLDPNRIDTYTTDGALVQTLDLASVLAPPYGRNEFSRLAINAAGQLLMTEYQSVIVFDPPVVTPDVSVRVTDPAGVPIVGAQVLRIIFPNGGGIPNTIANGTDADGTATFDLQAGSRNIVPQPTQFNRPDLAGTGGSDPLFDGVWDGTPLELNVIIPFLDDDVDGIPNVIECDPDVPGTFCDDDGIGTIGAVIANGTGVPVEFIDLPDPEGVRVVVKGTTGQAKVHVCGFATLAISAGGETDVTCGSVTVGVITGPVEIVPDAGAFSTVSIPTGVTARLSDVVDNTFTVTHLSGEGSITVTVVGVPVLIRPGDDPGEFNTESPDTAPPDVTGVVEPAANAFGWNDTPVIIDWISVDPSPSSGAPTDPPDSEINTEGGVVEVSSAESCDPAGNCSTGSLTLALDFTDPSVAVEVDSDPNGAGWFSESPTVTFTCADAVSGVQTCPGSVLVSEGADQSVSGTAVDFAGNQAFASVEGINVDLTPPQIEAFTLPPFSTGWLTETVIVGFDCSDVLSGVASCPDPVAVGEGAEQSVTGTAVDNAGNEASVTVSGISVDASGPMVSTTVTPEANPAGWNNEVVVVSFECSDGTSGVDTCPDDFVFDTEGADQSRSATAKDTAGNEATVDTPIISIDLTPPVVAVLGVNDGDVFDIGEEPAPDSVGCATTDALSGVANPAESVVSGGNPDGTGVFTVTCSGAQDVAGNATTTVAATYEVHYRLASGVFTGGPVKAAPAINSGKGGRTYPLRWTLTDGAGALVDDVRAVSSIRYAATDCDAFTGPTSELVDADSNGSGLSVDKGTFRFNWNSPSTGCWLLSIDLADGNTLSASFELR